MQSIARIKALPWIILVTIGVCWGVTSPLSKTAVSSGHHPIGVAFWAIAIGAALISAVSILRGARPSVSARHLRFYLICGFLGTAAPNVLSYESYRLLPIGITVMCLALVPMASLVFAVLLGLDRAEPRRLLGLALGVTAMVLIAAPDTSLPADARVIWLFFPIATAVLYSAEGVFIAAARPAGLDALSILTGLTIGALFLIAPLAIASGTVFDIAAGGPAENATIAIAAIHIFSYFGYVWLVGHAGPVFAAQVGYIVTGSGFALGVIMTGERHGLWVWVALALILAGVALVTPREGGEVK